MRYALLYIICIIPIISSTVPPSIGFGFTQHQNVSYTVGGYTTEGMTDGVFSTTLGTTEINLIKGGFIGIPKNSSYIGSIAFNGVAVVGGRLYSIGGYDYNLGLVRFVC